MALPFPKSANQPEVEPAPEPGNHHWTGLLAAGALAASGVLLITGKRRAGMVLAASGTALALLDQQKTLESWWKVLPGYLDDVQQLLSHVQGSVDELAAQREKLDRFLPRRNRTL